MHDPACARPPSDRARVQLREMSFGVTAWEVTCQNQKHVIRGG